MWIPGLFLEILMWSILRLVSATEEGIGDWAGHQRIAAGW